MSAAPAPPEVMESFLLSVRADPRRREVIFTFRPPKGGPEFGLRAGGVEYLVMNEFLQQNIVHEVRVSGRHSDLPGVRDLLAGLLFDKKDASEVVEPTFLTRLEDCTVAVVEERRILLEIEPVYGATVLLLAESVEWLEPTYGVE
jgi:hypothetical protein